MLITPAPTFSRNQWFRFIGVIVTMMLLVNPFSLSFLNDDFDSLPMYGQGQFLHNRGTRLFVELSLFIDYHLYGIKAWGYILTNLLIHAAACVAGLVWCTKMAEVAEVKLNRNFQAMAGCLFLFFAFHSETVFWTISRTASLGLLCFFGTWLCFFKAAYNKLWLAPAFVLMLCGLFSYETLMLLPLQLLLWHWLLPAGAGARKQTSWNLVISIAAIAIYLPIRKWITMEWIGSYEAKEVYAFNLFSLAKNYLSLLLRTFAPPLQNKILVAGIGSAFLLLAGLMSVWIIRAKKADKWWWFLLLNWLMSYVLFTSLGIDMSGYESERYLYVPSFFFCVWVMYSISLLSIQNTVKSLLALGLIAYHLCFFYIALTGFRNAGKLAILVIDTVEKESAKHPAAKTVVENLPDKAFGIPLFRLGISNGIKWLHPAYDTASLSIGSKLMNTKTPVADEPVFKSQFDSVSNRVVVTFFPGQSNNK